MPELPEVETIIREVKTAVVGKTILRATVHREKLRCPVPRQLAEQLTGKKIIQVKRRAKYILIELSSEQTLLIHLGMAGKLLFTLAEPRLEKHDHLRIAFSDASWLVFRDPRCFGTLDLLETKNAAISDYLRDLGPEPFSQQFSADYLDQKRAHKKLAVKLFLLDQKVVAGVGNIYASEILFRVGILPVRSVSDLTFAELEKLVVVTRQVLELAIAAAGTSLRDYVKADGSEGAFQKLLYVYGRTNLSCKVCQTPIQAIKQGGRSSFFCPFCQL